MNVTDVLRSSQPEEVLDDEHLVSRALGGDRGAFNQLVIRHEGRLFRFLCRASANAADVEDAMQHAFVKAYRKLGTYNPRYRFTTWLFTIAVRELRSLQRRSPAVAASIDDADHPAAPVEPDRAPGEMWAAARRLLHPQQHTALWLRYGEDLPVRDVAKVMNRPRVWVSVTLHRACATLRTALASSDALADDRPRRRAEKPLASVRASSETTSRGLP
jgi:RNA polymerase sigma-70 factor (ECF subfamily)